MKGRVRIYNPETGRGIVVAHEKTASGGRRKYDVSDSQLAEGYSTVETGQYVEFDVDNSENVSRLRPEHD